MKSTCSLIAILMASAAVPAVAQTQQVESGPGDRVETSDVVVSKLVSAESLEAEIKTVSKALAEDIGKPIEFSRGGYRTCRLHFSELAVLFQAVSQHDQAVPWKTHAAMVAAICSRNARNCKVGSRQAYEAAKQTSNDLTAMVGGSDQNLPSVDARIESLGGVAERPPLMSRMERGLMDALPRYLDEAEDDPQTAKKITREAEMLALIGAVIGDRGAEDADDDEYREHAQLVTTSAQSLAEAIRKGMLADARAASENLRVACNKCHESYR